MLVAMMTAAGLCSCGSFENKGEKMTDIIIPETWETGLKEPGLVRMNSVNIYPINRPAAGSYPQGLYKYPFAYLSDSLLAYNQTVRWHPAVPKTFAPGTQYTAIITLEMLDGRFTFKSVTRDEVSGINMDGVESVTAEMQGESLVVYIVYEETALQNAERQIIFEDNFNGNSLDSTKWDYAPEVPRSQSVWQKDMVEVSNGSLRIKFELDSSGESPIIRTGGVRSRKTTWDYSGPVIFENSYGYYEARIKFPQTRGVWGAFWLMNMNVNQMGGDGRDGTEIDIIEFISGGHANNNFNIDYNAAFHWDGYGSDHKKLLSDPLFKPVDIYDGQFHVYALDWSPSEYIFYIDGIEFWRVKERDLHNIILEGPWPPPTKRGYIGICQNPSYIKLTVEAAEWAGAFMPEQFSQGPLEMEVDYVRVYNQPKGSL